MSPGRRAALHRLPHPYWAETTRGREMPTREDVHDEARAVEAGAGRLAAPAVGNPEVALRDRGDALPRLEAFAGASFAGTFFGGLGFDVFASRRMPRAPSVWGPTIPSTISPRFFWNFRTAALLTGP